MEQENQKSSVDRRNLGLQFVHEALFSLNTGLMGMQTLIVAVGWPLINLLIAMEMNINYWLGIRQTDFIRGYFAFYVPSIAASLCIWVLVRLTSRSKGTKVLLYWIAGPLTLLAIPAYWHYVALTTNLWGWYGSQTWRYGASPFEAVLALAASLLYVSGRWPAPWWTTIPLLVIHFYFWAMPIHQIGLADSMLLGPLIGFCACLVWVVYIHRTTLPGPIIEEADALV